MSKPTITVIVPVYKAMATLDRCVESVVSQDVAGGLACILVDDGSPDDSGKLCDAWAARDPRVTVIHQDDLGVSGARNSGLAAADSEYIVFLDSDDALRPGALQAALDAQNAAPNSFVCWHYTTDENDTAPVTATAETRPQSGLARLWLDCLLAMPWNKLYRTAYARQVQFDRQYTLGEDLQFVLDYVELLGEITPDFAYTAHRTADFLRLQPRRDTLHPISRRLLQDLARAFCQAEPCLQRRPLPTGGYAPPAPCRADRFCRGRRRHPAP